MQPAGKFQNFNGKARTIVAVGENPSRTNLSSLQLLKKCGNYKIAGA